MRTGDDLRAARERAGLTQEALAQLVGVSHRSIGNWERGSTVPRNRLAKIESVLRTYLDDASTDPLRGASDVELLAEIARRFARSSTQREGGSGGDTAPIKQSSDGLAQEDYGFAARAGTPDNRPDTTTGEESQDPGDDYDPA